MKYIWSWCRTDSGKTETHAPHSLCPFALQGYGQPSTLGLCRIYGHYSSAFHASHSLILHWTNILTWPYGWVCSPPSTDNKINQTTIKALLVYLTMGIQSFFEVCVSNSSLPSSSTPSLFLPLHPSLSFFPHSHTFRLLSLNHWSDIWTEMLAELKTSLDDLEIFTSDRCTKSNFIRKGKNTTLFHIPYFFWAIFQTNDQNDFCLNIHISIMI